jgi:hypothetical protein
MLRRTIRFRSILLISATTLFAGVLAPAVVGIETAQAASSKASLDLCVVLPGFATPKDTFGLTTSGPKSFSDTAQLQASACGSYKSLPAGTYTVTQSQTASGWSLAQIYCYSIGTADQANGTVDLSSASATVKVTGPTSCIFAESPGGGGGGFSGGSGSSGKSGTSTTSTTKPGTTTTKPPFKPPAFCTTHPSACTFKPNKIGP